MDTATTPEGHRKLKEKGHQEFEKHYKSRSHQFWPSIAITLLTVYVLCLVIIGGYAGVSIL